MYSYRSVSADLLQRFLAHLSDNAEDALGRIVAHHREKQIPLRRINDVGKKARCSPVVQINASRGAVKDHQTVAVICSVSAADLLLRHFAVHFVAEHFSAVQSDRPFVQKIPVCIVLVNDV